KILGAAVKGELTEKTMRSICDDNAYAESFLTIIPALKNQKWQLLRGDLSTPIQNAPELPLTELQLRWLKAISLDPRIALFDVNTDFLRDVKPLFTPEDIVVTDKFGDGDNFSDPNYISCFRTLFSAVKNGKKARITYVTDKTERTSVVTPYSFEYSEREDKLRLWINGGRLGSVINLSRVTCTELLDEAGNIPQTCPAEQKESVVLEAGKERMTIERALLHFAHYEKETELLPDGRCRITLYYSKADRSELAVQVLSFGPMVKVVEPDSFAQIIRERLAAQRARGL
ncbi:MAG: WYL domain-containing protein, partial [Oscillospiraceae bacterium]